MTCDTGNLTMSGDFKTGRDARVAIRAGWRRPTSGLAPGYEQVNLVILPEADAGEFLRFAELNPKPCPVLDVTEPGSPVPSPGVADDCDIRTDLPLYRVYREGELIEEVEDISELWSDSLVAVLLGCSYSVDPLLMEAGIPIRHIERGTNNPMFRTNVQCVPAGIFSGPVVASMRPVSEDLVPVATEITSRCPRAHGGPIHVGDPAVIGVGDLQKPDYGEPVPVRDGEVPMFWACGVTPQAVGVAARVPLMITHSPGHMLILDTRID